MQDLNSLTRDQTCATYIGSTESFLKNFSLQGICFTILCWFLPYINMSQPQVYIRPLPLDLPASSLCSQPFSIVMEHWVELPVSHSQFPLGI